MLNECNRFLREGWLILKKKYPAGPLSWICCCCCCCCFKTTSCNCDLRLPVFYCLIMSFSDTAKGQNHPNLPFPFPLKNVSYLIHFPKDHPVKLKLLRQKVCWTGVSWYGAFVLNDVILDTLRIARICQSISEWILKDSLMVLNQEKCNENRLINKLAFNSHYGDTNPSHIETCAPSPPSPPPRPPPPLE